MNFLDIIKTIKNGNEIDEITSFNIDTGDDIKIQFNDCFDDCCDGCAECCCCC